ncbi:MAG: transcriptional regulator [Sulfurovum sp.]|nr:MAG: transcriptional regulator [Sulfurovum sp.]
MNQTESCCRMSVDTLLIESAKDMLASKEEGLKEKAKIFALLGNEVRLKMMTVFVNVDSVCVCDLSDILKMNQSPISQHLRKLKDAGLLESKREGMTIFYSIPSDQKEILLSLIKG